MSVHPEIVELLPWYVNGTANERDRERVDAHVNECEACRAELTIERSVAQSMRRDNGIEYMPAASLKRLQATLDGAAPADGADTGARRLVRQSESRPSLSIPYRVAAAVIVSVAVVGVLMLAAPFGADRTAEMPAGGTAGKSDFYTVTSAPAPGHGEVIRAVFSPAITLTELQRILAEAHLHIVSGPTEAGVYSLAADSKSSLSVADSLHTLREHDSVRFAEGTRPTETAVPR